MQNLNDRFKIKGNHTKMFFPLTSNPSRRADFCVRKNTASCVLSIPKKFPMLKTTCPLQGAQKPPKSVFVLDLNWIVYGTEQ